MPQKNFIFAKYCKSKELNIAKNIKKIAKEVFLNEARSIRVLTSFIDDDFTSCVEEILSLKGRVIITGIGKSAIIAQKIVATLNSTGTPSVFMHAADAIHGDLGIIQQDDMVICISKSGNTPEVKVLVPLIKRKGVKLVALVSNTRSFLAKQSDFVLNATIESEACPHNLAPTTSTTVHMAMGDALAVCILKLRGFSSRDFANLHPGGSLGKQLYLKVDDIYPGNELPIVSLQTPVKDAIIEISSKRLGAAAVLKKDGSLAGIITDGDIRRMLEKNVNINDIKVRQIMNANPKTVKKGDFAVDALSLMQKNNITQVIVMSGKKVAGFVHLHDLLKEGIV